MKKLTTTVIFLIILLLAGSKATIALFAYQAMEGSKAHFESRAAISYSWISSDLSGSVVIHDLTITPFKLKQTYTIEQAVISYDSLPALFSGLINLKERSWDGITKLELINASTPLNGSGLGEWLAKEYDPAFNVPLNVYGCGTLAGLTETDWERMGLRQLVSTINIDISTTNDLLELDMMADFNELGALALTTQMTQSLVPSMAENISLGVVHLHSIDLQHIEKGFFRRLSNYCTSLTDISRKEFAFKAAKGWQDAMNQIGLIVSDEIAGAYAEYVEFGGQAALSIKPQTSFSLLEAKNWLDTQLSDTLGLSISLNNSSIDSATVFLQGDYYRDPVIEAPKPAPLTPEEPRQKSYFDITWEELAELQNQRMRIRVSMLNGKIVEGTLLTLSEFDISISQLTNGGEFTVHPKQKDIDKVEIWR